MERSRIESVVNRISELPTLPFMYKRIAALTDNPRTNAADMAKVISEDQVLTGKLLKLVNSPFYGFSQKISTVTRAVVIIGINALKNLVLSTSVISTFKGKRSKFFDHERFWEHSYGVALTSKIIARHARLKNLEEVFVAGILHDIGKLVHSLYLGDDFKKVMEVANIQNVLISKAEKDVLGFSHADTGYMLLRRWKLPVKIGMIVQHHHQPPLSRNYHKETAVIHLADILTRAMMIGWSGDNVIPRLYKESWEELELSLKDIELILEEVEDELESVFSILK